MSRSNGGDTWVIPLLTILFVLLKVTGKIDWGWVWVLSPIWIGYTIAFIIIGLFALLIWWAKKE